MTALLDGLEADGLVARTRHPTDRRATLVTFTDDGAKTLAQLHPDEQRGARDVLAGVPGKDLAVFVRILEYVPGSIGRPKAGWQ